MARSPVSCPYLPVRFHPWILSTDVGHGRKEEVRESVRIHQVHNACRTVFVREEGVGEDPNGKTPPSLSLSVSVCLDESAGTRYPLSKNPGLRKKR